MEQPTNDVLQQLIDAIINNGLGPAFALGVGITGGLWAIGRFAPDLDDMAYPMPSNMSRDDAIAWHQSQITALKAIQREDPSIEELFTLIEALQIQINELNER